MSTLEKNIIPYGVQNFADLRRRGLYYVDKTPYIRELEVRSDKLFFVRPRRMGKSLFVDIAKHFAAAWVNRDGLNGELLVNGYVRAYLMATSAFMVRPEMELGKRFSDYSLFPDRSLDERRRARHSYVIELKYSQKDESAAEIAAKRQQALDQLKVYSEDPALPSLTVGTPTHYLYIHFKDYDLIACEEIEMAGAVGA